MRILFIANCSVMFGANRSMLDLAAYLKGKNEKVFFLLPEHGPIEKLLQREQFPYKVFPYRPCVYDTKYRHKYLSIFRKAYVRVENLVYNLRLISKIVRAVKEWEPDIVHSNSSTCDMGYYIARKLNCVHVWHIREMLGVHYDLEYNFKSQIRRQFHTADAVIYISDTVKEYSKKKELSSSNNIVIYDGFRLEIYDRAKNNFIPNEELHVLLCSNLYERKGHMDALEAVRILVKERGKSVKLFIAGTGSDIELDKIQHYISRHSLERNIELKGFLEDLSSLREWADIELSCSVGEALGRTVVEAMLAEVLVIGAASGATNELIHERVNGLKYTPREPTKLSEQIEWAYSHQGECFQIIKKAKNFALRNFDNNIQAEKVWCIYKELTADVCAGK